MANVYISTTIRKIRSDLTPFIRKLPNEHLDNKLSHSYYRINQQTETEIFLHRGKLL